MHPIVISAKMVSKAELMAALDAMCCSPIYIINADDEPTYESLVDEIKLLETKAYEIGEMPEYAPYFPAIEPPPVPTPYNHMLQKAKGLFWQVEWLDLLKHK